MKYTLFLVEHLNSEESGAGNSAGPSSSIVQMQLEIIRCKQQNKNTNAENSSKSPKQIESEAASKQPDLKQELSMEGTSDFKPISVVAEEVKVEAKVTSHSVADFFKERSRLFAAKEVSKPLAERDSPVPVLVLPIIKPELKRFIPVVLPRGQMAEKLRKAAPYSIFLTTVASASATHSDPLSVTFLELLDPSLGELESSVQLNFVVQIDWLMAQYAAAGLHKLPLLILHGEDEPAIANYSRVLPNVSSTMVRVPGAIGCHHAKVMLFFYKDNSMRVIISTANLYQEDWDNRVQGLWISERLPALSLGAAGSGESVTGFRSDLVRFLEHYGHPQLQAYIGRIKKSDFSSVKVFLMSSIPGRHRNDSHGHLRLASLLKKHSAPVDPKFPIIMQSSALGNFGNAAHEYLTGEIARSFQCSSGAASNATPEVKLMYPSLKNVTESHDGLLGGGCLPYFKNAHSRQPWLNKYLYQWRSKSRNRDRAMPHIKSYCRYSEDGLFWFVLTSANMSKSAWGVTKGSLNINSYELGVAFFPRVVLGKDHDHFPMKENQRKDGAPIFHLPFDIPLEPYAPGDQPFCMEDMREYQRELMAMQGLM